MVRSQSNETERARNRAEPVGGIRQHSAQIPPLLHEGQELHIAKLLERMDFPVLARLLLNSLHQTSGTIPKR